MKKNQSNPVSGDDLRDRTERLLAAKGADLDQSRWNDMQQLVHDLRDHLVELERQNRELHRSREALAANQDRYARLYRLAPVACFTLDPQGRIVGVNAAGIRLLGESEAALLDTLFIRVVAPEHHQDFQALLRAVPGGGVPQTVDLLLCPHHGPPVSASLESLAVADAGGAVVYHTIVRDISKRRQVEDDLRKSEALYRLIVETANEGIWGLDADYRTTYTNPVMAEMLGYRVEEMVGRPVSDFIFPEDLSDYEDKMSQLRQSQDISGERRLKRQDGSELWAIVSIRDLMDDRGQFQGSFAMLTDITQRKRAEEAQQLAVLQWRATFDAMRDGICLMDLNCRILGCNQAMATLVNLPVDEILGCRCYQLMHGTSQPIAGCPLKSMCRSRHREEAVFHLEGRWLRVMVDPILDDTGEPLGAVHHITDITEIKESEEALKESEAHFRQLFDIVPDAIYLHDQGKIVEVNEQACRSLGYTREELLRLDITDLEVEIDRRTLLQEWAHKPGKAPFYGSHRRKDGSTFPVEIRSREFATQGRSLRLGIVRDITAQKKAEEAIRESEDRFRELFNHMKSGVAIFKVTPDGKIIFKDFNRAAEHTDMIKKKSVLGKDVRKVFPGAAAIGLVSAILRVWESGQPEHIPMAFYQDARISGWRDSFIYRLPKGEVVAVYEDITRRVDDVRALQHSRETLRVLLDATPAGVMLLDSEGQVLAVNKVGAKFLKKAIEDLVGTSLFEHLPAEVLQTDKDYFEEIKRSRQPLTFEECRWERDFVNYVHPILTTSDQLTGIAVLSVDITERKQAEEALWQSREDLNRAQAVAHIGSWRLDTRRNELTWSDETYRMFGIPLGTPMTYEAFLAAVHPLDREYVGRKWSAALEGEPYDIEHRILVGNQVKWVRERAQLELDPQRQLLGGFGTCQDITERRQAEEALRQSRETLRVLFDATPAEVCLLDPQGIIMAANKQLAQRLGKAVEAIVGTCLFDYLSADQDQVRQNRMEQIRHCRRPLHFEDYRAGLVFDVYVHPILSAAGEVVSLAVLSMNITERKQAEEALRRSRETLRVLLDATPAAVVLLNPQGVILAANRVLAERLGKPVKEMVGINIFDYLPAELAKTRQARLEEVRRSGRPLVFEDSRGDLIFDNYIHPIFSGAGNLVGFAVLSVDITARKQIEDAMAEQSRFLQLLIDTIPTPIFYKDAEGRYLGCNQAFQDFYGLRHDQIVGKGVDCLGPPEQVKKFRQKDLELFQHPGVQLYDYTVQRGDSRKREVVINKATFLRVDGTVGGLIGVQTDVTEFKEAQKELRNLAARLAEAEELERQHLARELHDEVGQSLTALSLNLTMLKSQMPREAATPLVTRLTDAISLVEKTGETIRNVMEELRPPVLDDYGLLSALRWYGAEFSRRTGIGVDVQGQEVAPRLAGPVELALFRITQEALNNVAKHARANRVELIEEAQNGSVRLVIADDGVGFDQTLLGQPEGRYRWGLMNMKERAAAVGGSCYIESQPGGGTRVVVEVRR